MILSLVLSVLVAQTGAASPLFVPPKGWALILGSANLRHGELTQIGSWDKRGQAFFRVLETRNVGLSASDFAKASEKNFQGIFPGALLVTTKAISLCGSNAGAVLIFEQPAGDHVRHIRVVIAVSSTRAYMALYGRRGDIADDPAAIASQASLCVPGEGPVGDDSTPPIKVPPGYAASSLPQSLQSNSDMWLWYNTSSGHLLEVMQGSTASMGEMTSDAMLGGIKTLMLNTMTNAKVIEKKPLRLCDVDGEYVTMSALDRGRPVHVDIVVSPGYSLLYSAMYIRPSNDKPDTAAITAMESFCPPDPSPTASPTR